MTVRRARRIVVGLLCLYAAFPTWPVSLVTTPQDAHTAAFVEAETESVVSRREALT